eukprot:2690601-Prymnesium_polylepis.3
MAQCTYQHGHGHGHGAWGMEWTWCPRMLSRALKQCVVATELLHILTKYGRAACSTVSGVQCRVWARNGAKWLGGATWLGCRVLLSGSGCAHWPMMPCGWYVRDASGTRKLTLRSRRCLGPPIRSKTSSA